MVFRCSRVDRSIRRTIRPREPRSADDRSVRRSMRRREGPLDRPKSHRTGQVPRTRSRCASWQRSLGGLDRGRGHSTARWAHGPPSPVRWLRRRSTGKTRALTASPMQHPASNVPSRHRCETGTLVCDKIRTFGVRIGDRPPSDIAGRAQRARGMTSRPAPLTHPARTAPCATLRRGPGPRNGPEPPSTHRPPTIHAARSSHADRPDWGGAATTVVRSPSNRGLRRNEPTGGRSPCRPFRCGSCSRPGSTSAIRPAAGIPR